MNEHRDPKVEIESLTESDLESISGGTVILTGPGATCTSTSGGCTTETGTCNTCSGSSCVASPGGTGADRP